MSLLPLVSPDWLALRGAADAAARSETLAREAAALLPPGPIVVHDLGSGTGAMMRWLAPRLPGPQTWVLHDADAALLERAAVAAPDAVVVRASVERLDELGAAHLAGASLVTASALLDVLTFGEARRLVDACLGAGAPVLLSLSVTGRVELDPVDALDPALEAAFDDHQRRTLDGRRLLGPDAVGVVEEMLADAGWRVRSAATPWRLGADEQELTAAWLDGWLAAALEQRPELAGRAPAYRAGREAERAAGRLRVVVHHRDLLAWPA